MRPDKRPSVAHQRLRFRHQNNTEGAISPARNPLLRAVASACSFAARGFAGEIDHLAGLIKAAIQHKGFALIDILQLCVSFNRINTFKWYSERVYKIEDNTRYDTTNRVDAFQKVREWGDKIPLSIFYRNQRPTLEEQIPAIADQPLVAQQTELGDFLEMLENFK